MFFEFPLKFHNGLDFDVRLVLLSLSTAVGNVLDYLKCFLDFWFGLGHIPCQFMYFLFDILLQKRHQMVQTVFITYLQVPTGFSYMQYLTLDMNRIINLRILLLTKFLLTNQKYGSENRYYC